MNKESKKSDGISIKEEGKKMKRLCASFLCLCLALQVAALPASAQEDASFINGILGKFVRENEEK